MIVNNNLPILNYAAIVLIFVEMTSLTRSGDARNIQKIKNNTKKMLYFFVIIIHGKINRYRNVQSFGLKSYFFYWCFFLVLREILFIGDQYCQKYAEKIGRDF
jgi:hypothetical protein